MSLRKYSDFGQSNEETKSVVSHQIIENEQIKEEVLLTPKDAVSVEILEEKIVKFNQGQLKDILETLKNKYSDTDYYIRKKDNQLHVVKYNESLKLNINEFVNTLLKYYSTKPELKKITEGIKVKGNQNFSIIENMKFVEKFVDDITKLLAKKNNNE